MFENYETDGLFDEMFSGPGKPRAHYSAVLARLNALGPSAVAHRVRMADLTFRNQGITFTVYSDQRGVEKIFPFDMVPRIIPADGVGTDRARPGAADYRVKPFLPGHLS